MAKLENEDPGVPTGMALSEMSDHPRMMKQHSILVLRDGLIQGWTCMIFKIGSRCAATR